MVQNIVTIDDIIINPTWKKVSITNWTPDEDKPPTWINDWFWWESHVGYYRFTTWVTQGFHFVIPLPDDYMEWTDIYPYVNFTPTHNMEWKVQWELESMWWTNWTYFSYETIIMATTVACDAWIDVRTDLDESIPVGKWWDVNWKLNCKLTRSRRDEVESDYALLEFWYWYQKQNLL